LFLLFGVFFCTLSHYLSIFLMLFFQPFLLKSSPKSLFILPGAVLGLKE
jgi:hypothetical protein